MVMETSIGPFTGGTSYGTIYGLDTTFAPGPHGTRAGNVEDEAAIALTYFRGWTVMAMWDRSIDTRGASNAAFISEGRLTETEMWALAREYFPTIVARLKAAPKEP